MIKTIEGKGRTGALELEETRLTPVRNPAVYRATRMINRRQRRCASDEKQKRSHSGREPSAAICTSRTSCHLQTGVTRTHALGAKHEISPCADDVLAASV